MVSVAVLKLWNKQERPPEIYRVPPSIMDKFTVTCFCCGDEMLISPFDMLMLYIWPLCPRVDNPPQTPRFYKP